MTAISFQNGVEAILITPANIDTDEFVKIIPSIRQKGFNFTLFGDNASWHLSKKAKVH